MASDGCAIGEQHSYSGGLVGGISMRTRVDPRIFLTYRARDIQTTMSSYPTCVDIAETPDSALAKLHLGDFDQAPVTSNNTVIGWILQKDIDASKSLEKVFRPLSHIHLISDDSPLDDALQRLVHQELIFTIGSKGIDGFIVRSDIQRHVSRAHMYLLISGLEILMTRNVEFENRSVKDLVNLMSVSSRDAWERAKAEKNDANPIEYLDLKALGIAISQNQNLLNHVGTSRNNWLSYIDILVKLRNGVAHSNAEQIINYPFPEIVKVLKETEEFIRKINNF